MLATSEHKTLRSENLRKASPCKRLILVDRIKIKIKLEEAFDQMIFLLFLISPFSDVNEGKEWIQHENNPKSSVLQIKIQAEHILLAGCACELFA